jgi:hypothetical protein
VPNTRNLITYQVDTGVKETITAELPHAYSAESNFTMITHTQIFICGGKAKEWSQSVCIVNIPDLAVSRMANMLNERHGHGLVKIDRFIYVFGRANHHPYGSAEVYNTVANKWEPIPDIPFTINEVQIELKGGYFTASASGPVAYIAARDMQQLLSYDTIAKEYKILGPRIS